MKWGEWPLVSPAVIDHLAAAGWTGEILAQMADSSLRGLLIRFIGVLGTIASSAAIGRTQ